MEKIQSYCVCVWHCTCQSFSCTNKFTKPIEQREREIKQPNTHTHMQHTEVIELNEKNYYNNIS